MTTSGRPADKLGNRYGITQQLSVPKERLDKVSTAYLDQLASEDVLTFDGRRYGFGHEKTPLVGSSRQHMHRHARPSATVAPLDHFDLAVRGDVVEHLRGSARPAHLDTSDARRGAEAEMHLPVAR